VKTFSAKLQTLAILILSVVLQSDALGQEKQLPAPLNHNSTVPEILEYLNQTTFSHARIGLRARRPGTDTSWDSEVGWTYNETSMVFSEGFKLVSGLDDCHIRLRNADVKVYESESDHPVLIDLTTLASTPGPYAAEFSTWLETVSYDGGRRTFSHTKNPQKVKLFGAWRTRFSSRGFFVRSIFGMEIPGVKRAAGNESMISNTVTFTFDDREMSERFNSAFDGL
jgi:hypothetical protein